MSLDEDESHKPAQGDAGADPQCEFTVLDGSRHGMESAIQLLKRL
jgi:hypothetical protein